MKQKDKIGLYFGSFNPIHIGHLIIANTMLEQTFLQEIWFVVSPQNPLKNRKSLLAGHHRLQLVKIAIDDNPRFRACDIELSMPQPSYTIHTLAYLTERYPQKDFCLIMGSDNFNTFEKWKNYQEILKQYPLIVYKRPGSNLLRDDLKGDITVLDSPLMEISSSYIRKQIKNGKSVRYLLTDEVLTYIDEMNFYK